MAVSALGLGCMNFFWAYGQRTDKHEAIRACLTNRRSPW